MIPEGLLDAWGVECADVIALAESRVFRVSTDAGTFVLKDLGQAIDPRRLEFLSSVTTHLEERGIRVQSLIPTKDGRFHVAAAGRWYALTTFLSGRPTPGVTDGGSEVLMNVGRAIGRMHAALAEYSMDGLLERTWHQDVANQFDGWLDVVRPALDGELATILATFESTTLEQSIAALSDLPEQLIHRDCHSGNIVLRDDAENVLGFIDCDHFCIAPRVFELAYYASGITSHVDDDVRMSHWLEHVPALLDGYDEIASLTSREREAFPYAVMSVFVMMAWWFELTGHHDWALGDIRALEWARDNMDAIRRASS